VAYMMRYMNAEPASSDVHIWSDFWRSMVSGWHRMWWAVKGCLRWVGRNLFLPPHVSSAILGQNGPIVSDGWTMSMRGYPVLGHPPGPFSLLEGREAGPRHEGHHQLVTLRVNLIRHLFQESGQRPAVLCPREVLLGPSPPKDWSRG